jgi:four helix bundle protein
MRDHTKLRVFELGDSLAKLVYAVTREWPSHESFGMISQVRRCAVSVPSNIVEGCGCETEAEFRRFICIAYRSSRELDYQLSLAEHFGYSTVSTVAADRNARDLASETAKALGGFLSKLNADR